jgi:cell division protein FtsL
MAAMTMGINMAGEMRGGRSRSESVAERNRECFERQRRSLRGGTPEVFFVKHIDNTRIVKADDPVRRREMRMFTAVMTVLFVLVMVYVWQHFSAIEMGYQIEAQKTQVEQLREQNRQLRLSEAQLSEPQRIDAIAKQLGMGTPRPGQVIQYDGSTAPDGTDTAVATNAQPVATSNRILE